MAGTTPQNVLAIAELEAQFQQQQSRGESIADRVTSFAGSIPFVLLHLGIFALWILWNSGVLPAVRAFDPYPFVLLTLLVSFEAVLLSTFVLIKQNRMARASDRRDHLNLQIDILAEQEATQVLVALRRLCRHFGIEEDANDAETASLTEQTAIDELARQVDRNLGT